MRMTLARARGEDEEGTLEFNGATLKFTYNRDAISHKEWRKMRALFAQAQENPEDPAVDWVIPYLAQTLTGWDLVVNDSDRKPVPITTETLEMLPTGFLGKLLAQILETVVPPTLPETPSGSFS
jgi:hypothetical protein